MPKYQHVCRKIWIGICTISAIFTPFYLQSAVSISDDNLKHELGEQIDQLETIVPVVERSKAIDIALPYFNRYPQFTEQLLGQAVLYFPTIEKILSKYNLPEDLKYIPFIESGFRVNAVSPVGARGLWQFMEGTGKKYGLTINREVDERYDFIKSTEAAALFLRDLYEELGNWALVLMAYNGGPYRVKRLIKDLNTSDVHTVMSHMPRESQNYLSKMIAAKLIFKSYPYYGIVPQLPDPVELYNIHTTYITSIDLQKIGQEYGIEYNLLRQANPHLKYRKINNPRSNTININIPVFASKTNGQAQFRMQTFFIKSEKELEALAGMLKVNPRKIELVNQYYDPVDIQGKLIQIPVPLEQYMMLDKTFGPPPVKQLNHRSQILIHEKLNEKLHNAAHHGHSKNFLAHEIYYLKPSESLLDVASRLNIPLEQIKNMNPNMDLYESRRFFIPAMNHVAGTL
ncbi:MAG TPA: lytic transglycosylase domain-containing protein [Membranihabitans sp.]|nr:lytic transglycosylase domain-containing protein [Membranihabitans sp.]